MNLNKKFISVFKRSLLALLLLLCLSACNEKSLVQDLNQKQAQEIVTSLAEQGISSGIVKEKGAKGKFAVVVAEKNFTEAVVILHYNNLPKAYEPSLNEILEARGFLPNSKELEALRIERALASELESMIKVMPSVQDVKAVVRRGSFSGMGPPSPTQLSVLITSSDPQQLKMESLKSLIINLVQGVTEQSIVIDIQPLQQTTSSEREGVLRTADGKKIVVPIKNFLGWFRIAADDYDKLVFYLSVGLLVFLLVGAVFGFLFGFLGRKVVTIRSDENLLTLQSDKTTLTIQAAERTDNNT